MDQSIHENDKRIGLSLKIKLTPKNKTKPIIKSKIKTIKSKLSEKVLEEKRAKTKERTRRYRERLSQEALEKKREYDRSYKAKRKAEGSWKTRNDMGEREKRRVRKETLERVRKCRAKKKEEEKQAENCPNISLSGPIRTSSAKRGRKVKALNRAKVYKDLKNSQIQLKQALRLAGKYKKRLQRINTEPNKNNASPSPSKKVMHLAGGKKVPTPVKKRLVFLECVSKRLEDRKKTLKNTKDQKKIREFNELVSSPELKKRRLIKEASKLVTYKEFRTGSRTTPLKTTKRKLSKDTIVKVKKFYCQDLNSKMMPGKKDFITRKKVRRQKRLLLDTIKNLHKKFLKEHCQTRISIDKFRLLKPFWVVPPKLTDRNTCACKMCSNIKLLHHRAYSHHLVRQPLKNLIKSTVCNEDNKTCMTNACMRCKTKTFDKYLTIDEEADQLSYEEWKSIERKLENKDQTIQVTKKVVVSCTKKELLDKLTNLLNMYKCHIFKIKHQFDTLRNLKSQLNEEECIIHIDFSENYLCQSFEEVQSCHFGGSKRQLSLHTVVLYGKNFIKSMCTVCEDTDHKAYAVWAHLEPVFNYVSQNLPKIHTIHFKSDGPSSQYKNKFNLYFLTKIKCFFPKIQNVTWNFSVAGHGKGPADGIGGVVKRTADSKIKHGKDIVDASSFIEAIRSENIKVLVEVIQTEKILEYKMMCPTTEEIAVFKGISKILQVCWTEKKPTQLFMRTLSCFSCYYSSKCEHHFFGVHTITNQKNPIKSKEKPVEKPLSAKLNEGSWVAVIYDDIWYPGIVEKYTSDSEVMRVNFMERVGRGRFIWPNIADRQDVLPNGILDVISPPFPVTARNFTIPDMEKVDKKFNELMYP